MRKFETKLVVLIVVVFLATLLLVPIQVFATNEDLQIVKSENGDAIIYVKDLLKTEFKFALVKDNPNEDEMQISYTNSLLDDDTNGGNQVAFIASNELEELAKANSCYLYIKVNDDRRVIELDLNDLFDVNKMKEVETSTNRINTEILSDIVIKDETIDGIRYINTVGGLKITDENNAKYFYQTVKLPAEDYSELQELSNQLSTDYESKDMYSKIEFAKKYYDLYKRLIDTADWEEVQNMEVQQPKDAKNDDRYIVLLKKVNNEDLTEEYDVKFMISKINSNEEVEPAKTETRVVQETAKLPITGESLILFVILAVIIVVAIIVFIRMKNLKNKEENK